MKPQDFFDKYAPYAINTQIKFGIPSSITLAQAALESGWGESTLTKRDFNFFGIKDQANDEWYGAYDPFPTREVLNGQSVIITANFRKYNTPEGGFNDHASFLLKNSRYKKLFSFSETDYMNWALGLKAAGYATAPEYANSLINLIQIHKLSLYDLQAIKKKSLG